ncbi:MAG: HAMP domain-containing protein, partial [Lachnospiraceae bacterium]|nr:HAMP domain-containing protein [Lachnospiraceae bacterium]
LDSGDPFIMWTAIESIRDSARISNRFFLNTALIGIVASSLVIWWLSKRISGPILELADISRRMTELDFNAKFFSSNENEIGYLGRHMNQLSETLEETISELKTANNELQKDIEQKIQIDEMRKEFLSNVSHELKTPIALIQGYAEGLKECINDDPESRDFYCEVIMDEAGKMNTLVKNLLSLNQLEWGHDKISMERFDIVSLIRNILNSSGILMEQKGIRLIFKEEDPVYVWADEFKVEQVVTNYISNAINHCENEKIIEVKLGRNTDTVRVYVFNTGQPIPESDLTKIWIKFYKVDKARTHEYGGNGIGLSIVKAVMDAMNQECGVRNYDNGVEFWFDVDGGKT